MDDESMASKTAMIEALPLAERADAYLELHDELAERLEARGPGA